jgi:hypothetical protein
MGGALPGHCQRGPTDVSRASPTAVWLIVLLHGSQRKSFWRLSQNVAAICEVCLGDAKREQDLGSTTLGQRTGKGDQRSDAGAGAT